MRSNFNLSLNLLAWIVILSACQQKRSNNLIDLISNQEKLFGKTEYLSSPFAATGDRLYIVGHQDGSFPDLGWHVEGEMGGVWDHPIKLMDGYSLAISTKEGDWCLSSADRFANFPIGNVHYYSSEEMEVERYQFVPDGLEGAVIGYRLINRTSSPKEVKVRFTAMIDLMPVWLWDSLGISDTPDTITWLEEENLLTARDSKNDWFLGISSGEKLTWVPSNSCHTDRKGLGRDATLALEVQLAPSAKRDIYFYVAGSYQSADSVLNTLSILKSTQTELFQEKESRYRGIDETTRLITGDAEFDQFFRWTKYSTDWLVREVPAQGRAVSAGLPDYPWWFGTDGAYIIQGLLMAGMHDEALTTIDLIIRKSRQENGNGRIVHEMSTNGVVYNPGNLNTTPTFIRALWKAYTWTGAKSLLEYYDDIVKGIAWLESQDMDQNGYPDGPGMMEIHGLHTEMIDVVSYQAAAYQAAANFAEILGDTAHMVEWRKKADMLIEKVNTDWWVPQSGSYADFRATKGEALELIDAALIRADTIDKPWSVRELTTTRKEVVETTGSGIRGYVVHHNWVVNTPMEVGIADPEYARIALNTARTYRNRFGMFVTGIDRNEQQEQAEKWKSFSYVGAVMTLPTGVQAISEANYGNSDESLNYLKMLQSSFGYAYPGSMYEVSPDFGMIMQGWNVYAVMVPVVSHFFGVNPNATEKSVTLSPRLPTSWDSVSLKDIRVDDNRISINVQNSRDQTTYVIQQTKAGWTIRFVLIDGLIRSVNGQPLKIPVSELNWTDEIFKLVVY